ncbi:MAG: DUF1080 domain-containing protein [Chitinophagaceae bacterium]|nr:DUF1080 domain-containing protein [Chitinophagaceae bacterium]
MKKPTSFFILLTCLLFISCNQKSETDASEEWVQLFNKKDLEGWDLKITKHPLNENLYNTFSVKDSLLRVDYSGYPKFDGEFGHLYYKQPFSWYRIRIEYRFTGKQLQGGPDYAYLNGGVMLHSQSASSVGKDQAFPISLEMQFLASDEQKKRPTGNLCTPGTEVSIKGHIVDDHCINASSPSYPADMWVTAEAIVMGDSIIQHIINDSVVLTYEKTHIGGGLISPSFSWARGGFGADSAQWLQKSGTSLGEGYIALQAESHPIEFRKVELLNLKGCMDPKALNFKPYYLKADNAQCKY